MRSSPKVVNRCIDSLYLRVGRSCLPSPSNWLVERFSEWRLWKESYNYSAPSEYLIELPGLGTFKLLPNSHRPYEFVLTNDRIGDIRLWNPDRWTTSIQTGQIYLDFRSQYLQFQGLELLGVQAFCESVEKLFYHDWPEVDHHTWFLVSRADPAADIMWRDFEWSDLDNFVYRSRQRDVFTSEPGQGGGDRELARVREKLERLLEDAAGLAESAASAPPTCNKGGDNNKGVELRLTAKQLEAMRELLSSSPGEAELERVCCSKKPETIYFGRFTSPIYARLYLKYKTLELHSKQYMRDVWLANGWDGETPVVRGEFSMSADFLKSASPFIELHDDFGSVDGFRGNRIDLRHFHNFIAFLPELWAYCTQKWLRHCDPSISDSQKSRWETSEFWVAVQGAFETAEPSVRIDDPPQPTHDQIKAQAVGCVLTWAAILSPEDDSTEGIQAVLEDIAAACYSEQFQDRLPERRRVMGIDDFSDNEYSRQCRSWRLLEGVGS